MFTVWLQCNYYSSSFYFLSAQLYVRLGSNYWHLSTFTHFHFEEDDSEESDSPFCKEEENK